MTEGERIRILRKSLPEYKTLEKFGKKVGVTPAAISFVETNTYEVSDRLRRDICREFNASEVWLRTGEGPMFNPQSRDELISSFLGELLSDSPDFRHRLVSALATMTVEEWAILERKIREITEGPPPEGDGPAVTE